jgi:hypothetical protein
MKTIIILSLLPIVALASFFSAQFYIAAEYLPAYALIALSFVSFVCFVYQIGSRLEKPRTRIV